MPPLETIPDDQLWQQSRAGDHDAFGRIVERYQSLICSLAYSACGNLARSEDLAQETFVTAWQRLGDLREPAKLRAWLCGIVRNLAANAFRREQRRGGPAESLDAVPDAAAPEADPAEHAVSQEEAVLLWRALERLPETSREPMVLFYRQQQSITEVASALELSEEAVRQRLSRGRAMLRDEMTALVESTLTRTKPGSAFTLAVMVALPLAAASSASAALTLGITVGSEAATVGYVGSGGGSSAAAAGKGMLAKLGLGVLVGPLIGLVCAWFGTQIAASTARSPEERARILRAARGIAAFCLALSLGLAAVMIFVGRLAAPSAAAIVLGTCAWTAVLLGGIFFACRRLARDVQGIRLATNTGDEAYGRMRAAQGKRLRVPRRFESKGRFVGLPLVAASWGGEDSDAYRARPIYGWLALGDIAVSPFLAFGGVAIAPIAIGGVTIGVLSLSLWGIGLGLFAVGSLAFGWWAVGFAAVGGKAAAGLAAVARDYAVGVAASGAEANTPVAKAWFQTEWISDVAGLFTGHALWWALGCVILAVALRAWRDRREG